MADFNNPWTILGAGMMAGADPNRQGLGGLGEALLNTRAVMSQEAQLAEENQRARALQNLQFQKFQQTLNQQGTQNLSKSPTYTYNPQTQKYTMWQLSATGQPYAVPLPEGQEPVLPVTPMNLGGQTAILGRGQVTPSAIYPHSLAPEARPETKAAQTTAVEQAKSTAQAQAALPVVEARTDETLANIDALLEHPGLPKGTGWGAKIPAMPGSDLYDFRTRLEQLAGSTFLEAIDRLRGSGQITEIEGQQARAAIARMDAAQSEDAFRQAVKDYRRIVQKARDRARKAAGVNEAQSVDWNE